jgi:hypothetical protein
LQDSEFYPPVALLWYPTSAWTPGTPVQATTLPWTLDAERFVLAAGVYTGDNWAEGERLPVTGAGVPVLEAGTLARLGGYERTPDGEWVPLTADATTPATAPAKPLDVRFGEQIRLRGVTLPERAEAGDALPFTLVWQADAPVDRDYTAFAHVLDGQGNKAAQLDWQPHDPAGRLPTTAWLPGQPVVDTQTLVLPGGLAPGPYRVVAGLYYWQDGVRLPVQGPDAQPGDVVDLGIVQVE